MLTEENEEKGPKVPFVTSSWFSCLESYYRTIARSRRSLAAILGLLLLAALIYALLVFRSGAFSSDTFFRALQQLDPAWLAVSLLFIAAAYLGRAWRWIRMMNPPGQLWPVFESTLIGFTAVTLFGRPGELARPYLIGRAQGVSLSSQIAVWVLERIYDLLIIVGLFGFALLQADSHPAAPGSPLQWVFRTGGVLVTALGLLCLGILVAFGLFAEAASRRIGAGLEAVPEPWRTRIRGVVTSLAGGFGSTRHGSRALIILLLTGIEWLLIAASNTCLLKALPATAALSFSDNLVFLGFVSFGAIIQIPGVGGGFQVAAVLVLTEFFRVPLEPASAAALWLWIVMYVAVVPFGLVLAIRQGLNWRKFKQLQNVEESGEAQP